ncbi:MULTISPECIES: hypothetical protein [unclassified Brenneria]|uniref:hypothetical protein n=1 Tax=unclassified Brenneria TaxID=2634434 RepID=UPI0029C497DE|nr:MULTISPECIES: hypothetical protein [unclassified Brenneria]MDX5628152.1 hypothetical protein [Brenneria sp. L3-3Z]MDX5694828.1 hypothetical protein [Brenneria sp. L4-2C]MEE3660617.1 hypothetical protein [Brenneria sp. g21c3]
MKKRLKYALIDLVFELIPMMAIIAIAIFSVSFFPDHWHYITGVGIVVVFILFWKLAKKPW